MLRFEYKKHPGVCNNLTELDKDHHVATALKAGKVKT